MFWKNYAKEWSKLTPEEQDDFVSKSLKKHLLGLIMFERSRKFSPAEIKELQTAVLENLQNNGTVLAFREALSERFSSSPRIKAASHLREIFGDFFWELEEQGKSYLELKEKS